MHQRAAIKYHLQSCSLKPEGPKCEAEGRERGMGLWEGVATPIPTR